jgi:Helix-turn-helix domain
MAQPVAKLRWLSRVVLHAATTPAAARVAALLADFPTDVRGMIFPSLDTMAKRTNLTVRAVRGALRKLEALGELRVVLGGGRARTNRYELKLESRNDGSEFDGPEKGNAGSAFEDDTRNAAVVNPERERHETRNDGSAKTAREKPQSKPHVQAGSFDPSDESRLTGKFQSFGTDHDSASSLARRVIAAGVDRIRFHDGLARIGHLKRKGRHEARRGLEELVDSFVPPGARTAPRIAPPKPIYPSDVYAADERERLRGAATSPAQPAIAEPQSTKLLPTQSDQRVVR